MEAQKVTGVHRPQRETGALISVRRARELIAPDLSMRAWYLLIRRGEIASVRVGRRVFAVRASLDAWMAARLKGGGR
jgi:hypothetical protein